MTTTILPTDTDQLRQIATDGVRAMIALTGDDPTRPGVRETPRRVVDALLDMTDQPGDPEILLGKVFNDVEHASEQITVGPIHFDSVCEHHLLPFTGVAWISYMPAGGSVVGLSKLPRLVDHYARRLQVQERLTEQIAEAIDSHLQPHGVAVKITASHACMAVRGVRKPEAQMTTYAFRGIHAHDSPERGEFLMAVH